MTDIVPVRNIIQQEEVAFRASLSENTMTRLAQSSVFLERYLAVEHNWKINGSVNLASGIQGLDGILFCFTNIRIVGYSFYMEDTGASSSTIVDVHEIDSAGVDQGSIFSTLPEIQNTASNSSTSATEYFLDVQNQVATGGGGHTEGLFNSRDYTAGTSLRFDVDQGSPGSENLNFKLLYIPL